ncbi:GNAT family N-acetyltransferase [Sphingomonas sp.]|uniref:GNAT family N-acetyltransferase n=1 Tax=Sphingomonas sp. TaxID=28214 RepID=UPI0025F408EC|nr:GNAT family N-acetyltransferase [Sphingomonas sp.]
MIRLIGTAERRAVCAMLARAFADDPAMCWLFPEPAARARRLPGLFHILYNSDGPRGVRLATGELEAATLWRGPGAAETGLGEMLRQALPLLSTFGLALPRALALSEAIDLHMPREPFWYLHIAGCDPVHQGRGLGRAAVSAGLDRFTGTRLPAYLETATERNLGFYQSLGFRVIADWRVGRDGPRFWSMRREAV